LVSAFFALDELEDEESDDFDESPDDFDESADDFDESELDEDDESELDELVDFDDPLRLSFL